MSEASGNFVASSGPGRSVRFKLLAIALLPTLVILPLLLGIAIVRWNAKFDAALISKVNGDLTIAHQYLSRILENTGEHLQALGGSMRFRDMAAQADTSGLARFLEENRQRLGLDFLFLMDAQGNPVSVPGLSLRGDRPVVVAALAGEASTEIEGLTG